MSKPATRPDIYDVSHLSITDEPFSKFDRRVVRSKYDAIFEQLQADQRLRCHPDAAARLAAQLRKWLEARGHTHIVTRARTNCGDGMGGVWWMREAQPPVTTLAPRAPWPESAKRKAA